MSWANRYQKASFRGAKFNVEASSAEVGRRAVFYDLPTDESGGSASRDMGMLPRRYSITAVLCGDAYDAARDDLIEALEKSGPGDLVHPYYGKMKAVIDGPARITETTAEGGLCRIEFTFRRHRDQGTPALGMDTLSALSQCADIAMDALNGDLVGSFGVDGVQEFVRAANLDVLDNLTDGIKDINRDIDAILSIPGNIASSIDEFSRALTELINTPQKLINTIQAFLASIMNSISRVTDAIGALLPISKKAAELGSDIASVTPALTPMRLKQRSNQTALIRAVRGSAIASVAKISATLTYTSTQQAVTLRDTIAEQINELLESEELDSDEVYADSADAENLVTGGGPQIDLVHDTMRALRAALIRHLSQVAGALPAVTVFTPAETVPAIVLAYQLYGDASRDGDIADRNEAVIDHPSFVPGGQALEVISNA